MTSQDAHLSIARNKKSPAGLHKLCRCESPWVCGELCSDQDAILGLAAGWGLGDELPQQLLAPPI